MPLSLLPPHSIKAGQKKKEEEVQESLEGRRKKGRLCGTFAGIREKAVLPSWPIVGQVLRHLGDF